MITKELQQKYVRLAGAQPTLLACWISWIRVATLWNNSYNGLYFTKVCADCSFSVWNYKNWINWYKLGRFGIPAQALPAIFRIYHEASRHLSQDTSQHLPCSSMLQLRHPTNPKAGCNSWQWHWWPANQRLTVASHGSEILTSIKI